MKRKLPSVDFKKGGGLAPAVIQDHATRQVLMLGFMNAEALRRTLETGRVWFWSRTRGALWLKGETSGHYLNLIDIRVDCDRDTLLVTVRPEGPVCHTGAVSCFRRKGEPTAFGDTLDDLYALIAERRRSMPPESYTTSLFQAGLDRIVQKVGEEAVEVVIAAKGRDKTRTVSELADLVYHLTVLMVAKGIDPSVLGEELIRRRKPGKS